LGNESKKTDGKIKPFENPYYLKAKEIVGTQP